MEFHGRNLARKRISELKDVKCVGINENIIEKKYKGLGVAKKPGQGKRPKNERTN